MDNTSSIIVDAIRSVTLSVQRVIDDGYRSKQIDADDVIEILLTIAERIEAQATGTDPETA